MHVCCASGIHAMCMNIYQGCDVLHCMYIDWFTPTFIWCITYMRLIVFVLPLTGTDATHAEHIETIKQRQYVGVQSDGSFVPGELGMGLVEGKLDISA